MLLCSQDFSNIAGLMPQLSFCQHSMDSESCTTCLSLTLLQSQITTESCRAIMSNYVYPRAKPEATVPHLQS